MTQTLLAYLVLGGFIIYLLMSLVWILGYYADISTEWTQSGKERVDAKWKTFNKIYLIVAIIFLLIVIFFLSW